MVHVYNEHYSMGYRMLHFPIILSDVVFPVQTEWLFPEKYEHDTSGQAKYTRACEEEGVQPVRTFLNNMQAEDLALKHHCLGPKAIKALATPLEVTLEIPVKRIAASTVLDSHQNALR